MHMHKLFVYISPTTVWPLTPLPWETGSVDRVIGRFIYKGVAGPGVSTYAMIRLDWYVTVCPRCPLAGAPVSSLTSHSVLSSVYFGPLSVLLFRSTFAVIQTVANMSLGLFLSQLSHGHQSNVGTLYLTNIISFSDVLWQKRLKKARRDCKLADLNSICARLMCALSTPRHLIFTLRPFRLVAL